jgi:hypothetical protein
LAVVAAIVVAVVAGAAWNSADRPRGEPLLLFTSLPVYWPEAPDIAATLKSGEQHWARRAIEAQRPLRPLDLLDTATLGRARDLLMIQPRPLSPAENVALDAWVAGGGRLLLFADPALTADSAFPVGDRRRPQDMVLLSPILGRWGLRLEFDEAQPGGEHAVEVGAATLPVNLPGRLAPQPGGRPDASCRTEAAGVAAACRVGRGRVLAIADAALFEPAAIADAAPRRAALARLMSWAFEGP